ncbi:hypothetical protein COO60DRAFT_1641564 [Scenedesmus sp. NREL 46B-D3]|nr:hypothetical protein COO60DRAFT_1641564 [Scenedesmus sp. NREL 46B-D3]
MSAGLQDVAEEVVDAMREKRRTEQTTAAAAAATEAPAAAGATGPSAAGQEAEATGTAEKGAARGKKRPHANSMTRQAAHNTRTKLEQYMEKVKRLAEELGLEVVVAAIGVLKTGAGATRMGQEHISFNSSIQQARLSSPTFMRPAEAAALDDPEQGSMLANACLESLASQACMAFYEWLQVSTAGVRTNMPVQQQQQQQQPAVVMPSGVAAGSAAPLFAAAGTAGVRTNMPAQQQQQPPAVVMPSGVAAGSAAPLFAAAGTAGVRTNMPAQQQQQQQQPAVVMPSGVAAGGAAPLFAAAGTAGTPSNAAQMQFAAEGSGVDLPPGLHSSTVHTTAAHGGQRK